MNRLPSKEEIQKMKREISERKLVAIVEGKRDKEAVKDFGFKRVVVIGSKSLHSLSFKKGTRIVILTDFDREGKRKARKLRKLMKENEIFIEEEIRREFARIFKVKKIEEIKAKINLILQKF